MAIARLAGARGRVLTFVILAIAALAIAAPFLWIFRGAFSPTDAELYTAAADASPAATSPLDNFGKVTDQVPVRPFVANSHHRRRAPSPSRRSFTVLDGRATPSPASGSAAGTRCSRSSSVR